MSVEFTGLCPGDKRLVTEEDVKRMENVVDKSFISDSEEKGKKCKWEENKSGRKRVQRKGNIAV